MPAGVRTAAPHGGPCKIPALYRTAVLLYL
jgi:hypothetical protein